MKSELAKKAMKLTNNQLRQYNTLLRKNLRLVISCSEENEKAQQRIDEMEEILCGQPTLRAMFDSLITDGARLFGMDFITVTLDPALKGLYPEGYQEDGASYFIHSDAMGFMDPARMGAAFADPSHPTLRGNLRGGSLAFFPKSAASIRSEALVPLANGAGIMGVLGFGSRRPTRFLEEHGVRFLKRLGRTVTLRGEYFRAQGAERAEEPPRK
ncbi:MAG: DUF484 family protein, partial [Nitrospinae bacterium]|nr:DUF484 family protein [Nitrospinota bacterium]